MTIPAHVPEPASGYQIDAESVAEMTRLVRQTGLLSEHLGLFPSDLQHVRAMEEMRNDNFRAIAFFQSAWGSKLEEA
jgi:hypothetical protein